MLLTNIRLENFKNYHEATLSEPGTLACFTGKNGAGKTNLLDAIHLLCTGRSYFQRIEQNLMNDGAPYYALHGHLSNNDRDNELHIAQGTGKRKQINLNGELIKRVTEYYGRFAVVMIAPGDVGIIQGAGEERRNWLDSVISMVDKDYLYQLVRYDKLLKQRNALLRQLAERNAVQEGLLDVYTEQLIPAAEKIYLGRKAFLSEFRPRFNEAHAFISEGAEPAMLSYESKMHDKPIAALLADNMGRDMATGRTNAGPHRDTLGMRIHANDTDLKQFGSQGQQKTFLIALKMAQFGYVRDKLKQSPIMLLDDICERLDAARLERLFLLLSQSHAGQVFITDTSEERLRHAMPQDMGAARYFTIQGGQIQS